MLIRFRVVLALASPLRQVRHLLPLLGSGLLGLLIVGVAFLQSTRMGPSEYLTLLRVAAVTLAAGAAFLLNDPAIRSTAVVPVSRATRYVARLIQGAVIVGCWWAIAFSLVWLRASDQTWQDLPKVGLLLESATTVLLAVTSAAWLQSLLEGKPGLAASTLLVGLAVTATLLPSKAHILLRPGDPRWAAAQRFWGLLLVVTLMAFCLAARERPKRVRLPLRSPREMTPKARRRS